ncbi:MAG: succinate dehydrogenase cytochrome b subunit [Candidatus Kapabacteria bacterium]|nr:succinate dehydrogenase cytochrome b subunit [Candidatus Kapabacteria bacterium]
MASIRTYLQSTIMSKVIMALSGLAVIGFLLAHLAGNLLVFGGPEAINKYGQGLRDLGGLLWVLRGGIVVAFIAHIFTSIQLKQRNASARKVSYANTQPVNSTFASRTMLISGLSILIYLLFHLSHFTWGMVNPKSFNGSYILQDGRIVHDVYAMVVADFQNPIISIVYIVAVTLVMFHTTHAFSSAFQTLGINHPSYNGLIKKAGLGIAILFWIGYVSIPVAILGQFVK